jgi:hypothetical protein
VASAAGYSTMRKPTDTFLPLAAISGQVITGRGKPNRLGYFKGTVFRPWTNYYAWPTASAPANARTGGREESTSTVAPFHNR